MIHPRLHTLLAAARYMALGRCVLLLLLSIAPAADAAATTAASTAATAKRL